MNRKVGDGLLKKGGKRQRTGAGGQAREEEKRGCMLELKKKLGGRKRKQGSRLSGLATKFFSVYFIFFISLMFHSL